MRTRSAPSLAVVFVVLLLPNTCQSAPPGKREIPPPLSPSPPVFAKEYPKSPFRKVLAAHNFGLECKAGGWPVPEVRWFKDGERITRKTKRPEPYQITQWKLKMQAR